MGQILSSSNKQIDKGLSPLWAISSYALAYDIGLSTDYKTITYNEKLKHYSFKDKAYKKKTIYKWLIEYRNKLEKNKINYANGQGNGVGGSNNYAFKLPKVISGCDKSLTPSKKPNKKVRLTSKELLKADNNSQDSKSLYGYWIAAGCNELAKVAGKSDEGNSKTDIYVTCLGLKNPDPGKSNGWVVLAFVASTKGRSQNACAIYKFGIKRPTPDPVDPDPEWNKQSDGKTVEEGSTEPIHYSVTFTASVEDIEEAKTNGINASPTSPEPENDGEAAETSTDTDEDATDDESGTDTPSEEAGEADEPEDSDDPWVFIDNMGNGGLSYVDGSGRYTIEYGENYISVPEGKTLDDILNVEPDSSGKLKFTVRTKEITNAKNVDFKDDDSFVKVTFEYDATVNWDKVERDENGRAIIQNNNTVNSTTYDIPFFLRKVDKETGGSSPLGGASFENAVFKVEYSGKGNKTWYFKTDADGTVQINANSLDEYFVSSGEITNKNDQKEQIQSDDLFTDSSGKPVFPAGTYKITEVQAPEGYLVNEETKTFTLSGDTNDTTTDCWDQLSEDDKTIADQVKRGSMRIIKVKSKSHTSSGNDNLLTNLPFAIENLDTSEIHFAITDSNAVIDTENYRHTNGYNQADHSFAYDSALEQYYIEDETVPDSVVDQLVAEHGYIGIWFGQTTGDEFAEPDNSLRALPYGRYKLTELRCGRIEGRKLVTRYFDITQDGYWEDMGEVEEPLLHISTQAKDYYSGNQTGTVAEKDRIVDTVLYEGLEIGKKYKLKAEMHYAEGTDNRKVDGGLVRDKNGNIISGEKEFVVGEGETAPDGDGTVNVILGDFDTRALYVNGDELQGGTTVIYEYLYEIDEFGHELDTGIKHEDPNDEAQWIKYPWIGTHLTDGLTGLRMGFARENMVLIDTIMYKNFRLYQQYEVDAVLVDAETGLHLKDSLGHDIKGKYKGAQAGYEAKFTPTQSTDGTIEIEYELDSRELEGKTVVSYVTIAGAGTSTIVHDDITDEEETLHIPKIRTKAKDQDTQDEVGKVVGTFTDTVTYENLLPGFTYDMVMELMDKNTEESTGCTAKTEFTTKANDDDWRRSDGEVLVTYDLNQKYTKEELEAMTLVSFEECIVKSGQETFNGANYPLSDQKVAEHKDLEDDNQTIHYPKIRTTARDGKTADHVGTVVEDGQTIDKVECWNLVPGKEYTVEGTYWDTNDNAVLSTGRTTFTAKTEHEFHEVVFDLNSMDLDGHTAVIYEKLYHNGVEVTQHEEWEEEQQRIHYPKIETEATDSLTGDHVGTILGQLINKFRRAVGQDVVDEDFAGIVDTVEYWNLIPDMEYKLVGTLMNKETGEPILGEDGKPVTAERVIEAQKHDADGEINLYFEVDTSKLQNVTVVCFEKLYHNNADTDEPIEVTRHEDINDEEQSVHEVEIRTHANDQHVASDGIILETNEDETIAGPEDFKGAHYDWHTGDATGNRSKTYPEDNGTVIRDDVTLNNLVNGMTYTLVGTLHDKKTGDVVEDPDGNPYTVKKTFTVHRDTTEKRVDAVVPIEFHVDGKFLEGRTMVAFEELYHNDILITVHADIEDEDQSVYYPWIRTRAEDNKNGAKETQVDPKTEIVDHVYYRNLLPGKYVLEGVLMDRKSDDGYLHDAEGNIVTAEKVFTIDSKEDGEEGTQDLVFEFDSTLLKDHIAIAYENLYLLDEDDPDYKVHIAIHEDLSDEEESEWIIDIATKLTDTMDDSDEGEERKNAEWNDHVEYWGLKPGKEYTIRGILMDKGEIGSDGLAVGEPEPFRDANGDLVEGETTFVPETSCGFVDVKFEGDTKGLAGKTVVAFERLYPSDVPDAVIARHEDINDPSQFVNIIKIETDMDDQDTTTNISNARNGRLYTDHVSYTNLTVGRDYILKAVLMNKKTRKPILDENGEKITGVTRFTPETRNGTVDVEFPVDASRFAGKTLVCFERLYNAEFEDVYVAHHEDIHDEAQSIHVPKIKTKAKLKNKTVIDKMIYKNLLEDETYIARGYLVNTANGKKLKGSDGYRKFTAKKANGSVTVNLPVAHYSKLGGMKLTAYEELYIVIDGEEILVGEHKELKDNHQIVKIPKGPKTGDDTNFILYGALFVSAITLIIARRKFKKKA